MKKVTIAIPVYNDEKYISQAIDSALAQDYENIEILVVDDCSTDNTAKILKSYGNKIVVYKNKENEGIGFNRNECIRKATGDYLCFLSSDDYYEPAYVSNMVELNPKGIFAFTPYNIVNASCEKIAIFRIPVGLSFVELKVCAWYQALNNTMFCNYSTVFASIDFWKENMFDESYRRCEDLEHFLRILLVKGRDIFAIDKCLVNYRAFPEMGTNRIIKDIPKINERTIKNIKKELSKKNEKISS